jgi:hypothetical protein
MPERPMRCLLDVEVGAGSTIAQVRGETPDLLRYLDEHGLLVGSFVQVVAREGVAGTTTISVDGGSEVVVGDALCARIDLDLQPGAAA